MIIREDEVDRLAGRLVEKIGEVALHGIGGWGAVLTAVNAYRVGGDDPGIIVIKWNPNLINFFMITWTTRKEYERFRWKSDLVVDLREVGDVMNARELRNEIRRILRREIRRVLSELEGG